MKKGIYVMSLLLVPLFMIGQSFEVSVSSDSILFGNYIELKFTAENIDGKFEAPLLDDFKIISGPNQSSSVQIINSSTTSMRTWSYYIEPRIEGEIIIPPAYLITDEKTHETDIIAINIYPNPEGIIESPKSNNSFFQNFDFPMFNYEVEPPRTAPKNEPIKRKSSRQIKRI